MTSIGHKVGDEVLVKVSEVLQKEMRKYDTCIRYAGDEFVAFSIMRNGKQLRRLQAEFENRFSPSC